jgi:hypothetical protein
MIFQHTWQQVLSGEKTQTRRLVEPGDFALNGWREYPSENSPGAPGATAYVMSAKRHIRWCVLRTYAVQPGRGRKAVGRIRITAVRQERLQDISYDDIEAEGVWDLGEVDRGPRLLFSELWDTIHTKPGTRWADNPAVWVIEFEVSA